MEEYKIYSLNDPETGEVRYVGKTISPLYKRLSSHYRDKKHSYKTNWISKLKEKNLKPIINLIEECEENNWEEREKFWIAYYRKHSKLTNYLDGGQGQQKGYKHTDEAKEKIRLASIQNTKGKFYKGQCFETEINKKTNREIIAINITNNEIKEFNSISQCVKKLNIERKHIENSLRSNTIKFGYKFKRK